MKTATEIANITKTACERKIVERHDKTMTFINNTMCKQIEKIANNGEFQVEFKVDKGLDRDLINRVFVNAGYEVNVKGYTVKVSWFMTYLKLK